MQTMFSIYALADPRNGDVCYVGRSINPEMRYQTHLSSGCDSRAKQEWIVELAESGMRPGLSILDRAAYLEQAKALEAWWILHYVQQDIHLVNMEVVEARKYSTGMSGLIERLKIRSVRATPLQIAGVIGRPPTELENEVLLLRAEVLQLKSILEKIGILANGL